MRIALSEKIPGAKNFFWAEALWLPQWFVHVYPSEEQYENIIKVAGKLQYVRNYYKAPIKVHTWLRPDIYNTLVGGAEWSQHKKGSAVDFSLDSDKASMTCVRNMLEPKLEELGIRMELGTGKHVHIDIKRVPEFGRRTFYP